MYAEEFIKVWIKSEILMPKILLFKPSNIYDDMLDDYYKKGKKEVMKIENNRKNKKNIRNRRSNESTKNGTTGNTNKESVRRWDISSWDE